MALCAIDIGGNSWQDCVFAPEWKVIKCELGKFWPGMH